MNTQTRRLTIASALIAGALTLTACGGDTEPTATATETVTATATATAKPEVKTVTEEVEVVPQSCLDAIAYSDELLVAMGGAMDTIVPVFDMIPRAAEAGMNYDAAAIEQITAEVGTMSGDIQAQTAKVGPIREDYDAAVADCQGAGA